MVLVGLYRSSLLQCCGDAVPAWCIFVGLVATWLPMSDAFLHLTTEALLESMIASLRFHVWNITSTGSLLPYFPEFILDV